MYIYVYIYIYGIEDLLNKFGYLIGSELLESLVRFKKDTYFFFQWHGGRRRRTKTTVRLFEFGSSFFLPLSQHSAASNEMALRRFNAGGKKQKAPLMRFCKDIQTDLCGSIFDPLTVK